MDGVTLRHSCRFESFSQDDAGVTATVCDLTTDKDETIPATYLIACCGGRSPIRKSLGIELGNEDVLHRNGVRSTDILSDNKNALAVSYVVH